MSEIVEFPKKERMIWRCNCGSVHLMLYDDGTTECSLCGVIETAGHWINERKVAPGEPEDYTRKIVQHATVEMARLSVLKRAKDNPGAALIVIERDGAVTISLPDPWYHEPEGRQWLRERIPTVRELLTGGETE